MFRRTIMLSLLLVIATLVLKFLIYGMSNIKTSEFHPVVGIFLLDVSASNQDMLYKQQQTILKMAKKLDSEDKALIYVVTQDTYLVYDGQPNKTVAMRDVMQKRSAYDKSAYGTAYGLALKKAVGDALAYKEKGYKPVIVVLGDLENEGAIEKQINWKLLPMNIERTLKYIPDLSLAFLYAHPSKLDLVKQTIGPVMGIDNLLLAQEEQVEPSLKQFSKMIGR